MTEDTPPTEIDLAEVLATLAQRCGTTTPPGYVVGKTHLRDAAMDAYGWSALQAETIVDQLERRGFLRFEHTGGGPGEGRGQWRFVSQS